MNSFVSYYLFSLVLGAIASFASLPAWARFCRKRGLVDDPGHRKIHHEPIPLAGGLAVMTGLALPLLAGAILLSFPTAQGWLMPKGDGPTDSALTSSAPAMDTFSLLAYGMGRRSLELGGVLVGALGMLLLGWLDDKHELSAAKKFAGQLLIAGLTAAVGVRITLFVPSVVFSYLITVIWILTVTNAFNFIDNMNGLCAGLGAIAAAYFAITAARHGQYLVALIAFTACGALSGFLPHNFPRASAFLGDSGSHLVGYLLSVLAILPHFYTRKHPNILSVLSPLLILAVPLGDLVGVVLWRWRAGKPVYIGDTNHWSHRLVRRGWSQRGAVLWLWLLGTACGAVALAL